MPKRVPRKSGIKDEFAMLDDLPKRIVQLRERLDMTQKELHVAASIEQGTMSRIESGKIRRPGPEELISLARVLHCSTDYLLGLSDEVTTTDLAKHDPLAHKILSTYRSISAKARKSLRDYVDFLVQTDSDNGEPHRPA